ncbi:hypothetical protein [Paenibacillus amylolyticus]|uniref:hypothetical protein n=1 Tax=Paenibacillus amylolyticus TaxID=1451 RepID=UPI00201D921E|nr:hypothetical protein [Paenibacillus amylolyticus]MCL6658493.1 hypothetical protein [Paenibacillus amylolyticus]
MHISKFGIGIPLTRSEWTSLVMKKAKYRTATVEDVHKKVEWHINKDFMKKIPSLRMKEEKG